MKILKTAILISLLSVSYNSFADLNNGLVAYYCFDEATNIGKDCSTNGNNGSPIGQVNSVTGVKGNAANFGGYNNPASIHVPNSTSLQFSRDFSISFAVKMTGFDGMDGWGSYANYGVHSVIAKSHDRNGTTLMVYGDSATGNLGSFVASYEWNNPVSATTPYAGVGKWVYLTYVFSNLQKKAKLYANGILIFTKDGFNQDFTSINSQDLYLGKYSDSWFPLNGALDEVRIYNRALTDSEITALYKKTDAPSLDMTNATCRYVAPVYNQMWQQMKIKKAPSCGAVLRYYTWINFTRPENYTVSDYYGNRLNNIDTTNQLLNASSENVDKSFEVLGILLDSDLQKLLSASDYQFTSDILKSKGVLKSLSTGQTPFKLNTTAGRFLNKTFRGIILGKGVEESSNFLCNQLLSFDGAILR